MESKTYTAFVGDRRVARGPLAALLSGTVDYLEQDSAALLLIFEDQTGRQVDFDLRGTREEILARHAPEPPRRGPGRPRLGVVSREVSLLPRHWEWLEAQPGGLSAALRTLVDLARKRDPGEAQVRTAREAMSRFMTAMAGDRPGYEEASRALFAGRRARFEELIAPWPADVGDQLRRRAAEAFPEPAVDGS